MLQLSFLTKIIEKTRLLQEVCFNIRISLFNSLVVNLWDLAALRRHFSNLGWLLLTFGMTKYAVLAKFFNQVMIVTLKQRCFLFWLFSA